MSLMTRAYTAKDANAFRQLHDTCLAHYGITPASGAQMARILALLDAQRHMACHLAFNNNRAVGFTTWGLAFPAGQGISLVMKELFVAPSARQMGVGKALLAALIDLARLEGCARFDWSTDGTNQTAQAFYAGLGAPRLTKQNYCIAQDAFDAFQTSLRSS